MAASWINVPEGSDFPLANLPYGVFTSARNEQPHIGVAIGESAFDLHEAANAGLLDELNITRSVFTAPILNSFMALTPNEWRRTRALITNLLAKDGSAALRDSDELKARCIIPLSELTMRLPAQIGDYTDFYASRNHAYNIGVMFRGEANALQPNYLHLPVGYHGRSSTIVVSGTNVRRPRGQICPDPAKPPVHDACRVMDFELEIAAFVGGPDNELGRPLTMEQAHERLFGMVLLNDWSARDVQKWEYVPLGPFTAKNFASTISPWIVTFEALNERRCEPIKQDPTPLPYLQETESKFSYDIDLTVEIKPANSDKFATVSRSNTRYLYWSLAQQLCHHSVTGCVMRAGDMIGSGTISGTEIHEFGSMLELSWQGSRTVSVGENETRKFLLDGDEVRMKAKGGVIGFGECTGKLLPAFV